MTAIDAAEARQLLGSPDLIAIGVRADDVRRELHGVTTSFVRVFEVHVDAVPGALPAGLSAGEIRLVGDPSSIAAAAEAVRAVVGLAGDIPVTGFTLADVQALDGSFGAACAALAAAGLSALAEVQVDRLASGDGDAIAVARRAGLTLSRLTVRELTAVDRLDDRSPRQGPAAGGRGVHALRAAAADVLRRAALHRLRRREAGRDRAAAGAGDSDSIQVDWPLYGPKLAQFALTVGADDVDGVAAVDGGTLGTRRSPIEEIRGNIRAAGLEPVERDGPWRGDRVAWIETRSASAPSTI